MPLRYAADDSESILGHFHHRYFQRFHNRRDDTITQTEPFQISDARPPAFCPSVYIHASLPAAPAAAAIPLFPLLSLFCLRHRSLCYTVHLQGARKPCNTHTHAHSHSLTHTLTHTHTHSLTPIHTHTHTHTHSKYGCVLPSTDARRITVREITVNICSMNMMRLAERRRGEEDNLLCHLSLYGCLSYITPSLSLYLPAHLSLTHFHHLSFSVLPSFPPTFCLFIFSHSHAQLTPPPHSLLLSHSSHLSLVSPFPATSLRMPSLICLI